jgi:hypothetical protein
MPDTPLTLDEFETVLDELTGLAGASAVVGTKDEEAGRILRVLEYGSVAGEKPWPAPGPRTTLAVHPETGDEVVVSAQAPQGFVRVQVPAMASVLRAALARPGDWLKATAAQQQIEEAVTEAAETALAGLRATVPRDSGRLAASLEIGPLE